MESNRKTPRASLCANRRLLDKPSRRSHRVLEDFQSWCLAFTQERQHAGMCRRKEYNRIPRCEAAEEEDRQAVRSKAVWCDSDIDRVTACMWASEYRIEAARSKIGM